jgi:solute:Na+ symporter, SSS family
MILFIGILVYVFYLFNQPPVFHNQVLKERAEQTGEGPVLKSYESEYAKLYQQKRVAVDQLVTAIKSEDEDATNAASLEVKKLEAREKMVRDSVKTSIARAIPGAKTQDRDYIFLNFVLKNLPHGLIGLLLAVMFSAAMSSMASELNALASTTTIDIFKRNFAKEQDDKASVKASRWFTVMWAIFAMGFAMLASFAENLIQFVNIVGSLFYGTILGIFLTAFYLKRIQATAVFWAAIISECVVLYCYFFTDVAFLLFNIIGCLIVVILAAIFQLVIPKKA